MYEPYKYLKHKASDIKLLLTDNDGVLTDGGVYYSASGEELKKFNIRDGMGVARLREAGIETGIISGENSPALIQRALKLGIEELHTGIPDKSVCLDQILGNRNDLKEENIAYIGDDCNDLEIMKRCALTATPADALFFVKQEVDYVCKNTGGNGAFREFAELIIYLNQHKEIPEEIWQNQQK